MVDSPTKAPLPSLGGTLGFGEVEEEKFCTACNVKFATRALYDSHLPGATHKAALAAMGHGRLGGCEQHYSYIATLLEPVQDRVKG